MPGMSGGLSTRGQGTIVLNTHEMEAVKRFQTQLSVITVVVAVAAAVIVVDVVVVVLFFAFECGCC